MFSETVARVIVFWRDIELCFIFVFRNLRRATAAMACETLICTKYLRIPKKQSCNNLLTTLRYICIPALIINSYWTQCKTCTTFGYGIRLCISTLTLRQVPSNVLRSLSPFETCFVFLDGGYRQHLPTSLGQLPRLSSGSSKYAIVAEFTSATVAHNLEGATKH